MTTLSWLRFEWDLRKIPAEEINVPPPFILRRAEKDERDAVRKVVTNAFSMDTGWSDIQRMFGADIVRNVQPVLKTDPPDCVVVQHGHRIIAASIVNSQRRRGKSPDDRSMRAAGIPRQRTRHGSLQRLRWSRCVRRGSPQPTASPVTRRPRRAFCIRNSEGPAERWTPDFEVAQEIAA